MSLFGRIVPVVDLVDRQRDEMFALMRTYYVQVARRRFDADLAEKDCVVMVFDRTGAIRGFSTQQVLRDRVDGRPVRVLFSGDTIVDRACWTRNPLTQTWGRFALSLIDDDPRTELYWFLISKGFRTYRFLPVFFHEFHPRHDAPLPASTAAILDVFARRKFPATYDPAALIVRCLDGSGRLRAGVAEITPARIEDPHVRFFVEQNPGHARGDELCCIAPLTRDNFTPAAYRVIGMEPAAARRSRSVASSRRDSP
ncbi:MAG: hypothetical protein WD066_00845 [Planctomycetaceae bacterium]